MRSLPIHNVGELGRGHGQGELPRGLLAILSQLNEGVNERLSLCVYVCVCVHVCACMCVCV